MLKKLLSIALVAALVMFAQDAQSQENNSENGTIYICPVIGGGFPSETLAACSGETPLYTYTYQRIVTTSTAYATEYATYTQETFLPSIFNIISSHAFSSDAGTPYNLSTVIPYCSPMPCSFTNFLDDNGTGLFIGDGLVAEFRDPNGNIGIDWDSTFRDNLLGGGTFYFYRVQGGDIPAVDADTSEPDADTSEPIDEIREVIQGEAARSLRSTVSANQRMVRDARTRFIECGQVTDEDACLGGRNDVAFDMDGSFVLRDETLSTSGTFFEQTGNYEGTQRRLFFGDFDVQHDGDTGSTTATLTGRMAWEQMVSDRTMLGYFIGGELAYSNIDGAFEGDQDRIGATIGAYAVHQLAEQVYLDGFLTAGAGRNNLEMANDVLALESDYTTRTATIGAALSGVYDYSSYEFRPDLAFTYGRTWIGNVDFTYGLVGDTLSLDAGDVSIGTLILRPEVVWGLDADTLAESHTRFSFAPRLICESVDAGAVREDCGGGVELGLSIVSEDGLSEFTARVLADRIGNSNRSSFAINLEHRF